MGDVLDPARGLIVAGATTSDGEGFADTMAQLRGGFRPEIPDSGNTVIAVVATNAKLDKAGCTKVTQMSHDALAGCIYPAHTPADGDTVFAIATGRHSIGCNSVEIGGVGVLAADVLATAMVRGCRAAAT